MVNVWFPDLHKGDVLTWGVDVMSAGLGLCLWLGLSHHGGAERVHHGWLAGPRGGLRNVSGRPRGGAWAARVKGRGAAMETCPAICTTTNTAVAQIHWQSLLWEKGREVLERRGTMFPCGMRNEVSFKGHFPRLQMHNEIYFSLLLFQDGSVDTKIRTLILYLC